MEQFIAKAKKYILQEENLAARKNNGDVNYQDKAETSRQGFEKNGWNRDRSDRDRSDHDRFDEDKENWGYKKQKSKYHHYPMYKDFTALTRPVHEVFYSIERKNKSILPPPRPMKMSGRKFNLKEYCDYH